MCTWSHFLVLPHVRLHWGLGCLYTHLHMGTHLEYEPCPTELGRKHRWSSGFICVMSQKLPFSGACHTGILTLLSWDWHSPHTSGSSSRPSRLPACPTSWLKHGASHCSPRFRVTTQTSGKSLCYDGTFHTKEKNQDPMKR
jgi:hypothetical protein